MDKLYHDLLRKYWGYDSFRPYQLDVIRAVCSGTDSFVLMPTGGGKSVLYQIPGLVMEGVCLVVTPLISLMKDQVDRLRSRGIKAAAIHSGLTARQADIILDDCTWGDMKFLYVAPERLGSLVFRSRIKSIKLNLIAVDEAHCISQWGYDFRPSYLKISTLRDIHKDVPVLALTASATIPVTEDIMRNLRMERGRVFRSDFSRPNLSYVVRHTDDKSGHLLRVVHNVPGTGIVYTRTREGAEAVAAFLRGEGISSDHYHAGLSAPDRTRRQEDWTSGRTRIVVATNAFGMGIDKADVRFVVHYDIPESPEAYYQEAGRAGRDGKRSYAVLFVASDDRSGALRRFEGEFPPLEKIKECYEKLFNYLQIGTGDGRGASFAFNLYDFSQRNGLFPAAAFNMLKILQMNGYLTLTDESDNPPRIIFTVGRDDLYKIRIEREELDIIIRTILRLYEGVFGDRLVPVDEGEIAVASGFTTDQVHEELRKLWRLRIIRFVPGSRSPLLILNEERLPAADVYISPETYLMRKEVSLKRIEAIYDYTDLVSDCRSGFFADYFGKPLSEDCGCCDICINQKNMTKGHNDIIAARIVELLSARPMSVKQIVARFRSEPEVVVAEIDRLTAEGKISASGAGKIRLIG